MQHTPYGYEIIGGKAVIDEEKAGQIRKICENYLLTKSISRFARNTVDCLKYTRELKALNIAVFFEKENINTLDAKGEVPEYLDGKSFKKIKQGLKQTAYSMVQSMRSGMTPTSDRSLPTRSISVKRFSRRPTRSAF